MMRDPLISIRRASKKFCRRLRLSMWYGMKDLGSELIGRNHNKDVLRKGEFWAVKDITFDLNRGETLGLIGPNGAGKTTLLRMLNGLIKPDEGSIEIRGRMQALIALGAGFNPILTGRENIYVNAAVLGITKARVDLDFDRIVDFSGLEEFIDTPVQNYSTGMAVRLGFAVAAHMEPDILLVDEVLSVGDEGFQSKCLQKISELKKDGIGIILVSHNMHTISTYANRVMVLNNGKQYDFHDVSKGIQEYRKLFVDKDGFDIMKILSGNDHIRFFQVDVNKRELVPGESFSVALKYESSVEYDDAEIDIGIYSSREPFFHFQATNKAYGETVHLRKGTHELSFEIEDIRINDAMARVAIAIWAKERTDYLFWWEIPVEFKGKAHSTGNSFLNVTFRSE